MRIASTACLVLLASLTNVAPSYAATPEPRLAVDTTTMDIGGGLAPRPGVTETASVSSEGKAANGGSLESSISADGRFVAFQSDAANLVPGDSNQATDIFVRDRSAGTTTRISVSSAGGEGDGPSIHPSISRDGRFVAFESGAKNLVAADGNGLSDIFVHDRATGMTERVSVASNGGNANGFAYNPMISGDGRHVAFSSFATNVIPDDTNGQGDFFVRDLDSQTTSRVSVSSTGTQGDSASYMGAISFDGRYVAFYSFAKNLVPNDANGSGDAFFHDRVTGVTELISVANDGSQANDTVSGSAPPAISDDGRHVAFVSRASNLVPADASSLYVGGTLGPFLAFDIFVRDRELGRTERISVANDGAEGTGPISEIRRSFPTMSADGRYVVFMSYAPNFVDEDDDGNVAGFVQGDIFIRDRATGATERISISTEGAGPNGGSLVASVSADGRYVSFSSMASNLTQDNAPGFLDVFVHDRGPRAGIGKLSILPDGTVSGWATFSGITVAAGSDAAGDVIARYGDLVGASAIYRPETADLLFRWDVVSMPGFRSPVPQNSGAGGAVPGIAGAPGMLYGAEFRLGDRAFEVRALGTSHDPSFVLFDCTTECSQQAELTGGIGTAGEDVRVRVPVGLFGAGIEGAVLRSLEMFTAGGTGQVAQVPRLDEVTLGDAGVPARSVMLGRAPAGTPAAEVAFDEVAVLDRGRFSASLDTAHQSQDVWARACFGQDCETLRARRA